MKRKGKYAFVTATSYLKTGKNIGMLKLLLFASLTLSFTSCSRTWIGIAFVDCQPGSTDSPTGPRVRIINTGAYVISSVSLETQNGYVNLCGTQAGDTGKYFRVDGLCTEQHYSVTLVRRNVFGRISGREYITGRSPDEQPCKLITAGDWSFTVRLERVGGELSTSGGLMSSDN